MGTNSKNAATKAATLENNVITETVDPNFPTMSETITPEVETSQVDKPNQMSFQEMLKNRPGVTSKPAAKSSNKKPSKDVVKMPSVETIIHSKITESFETVNLFLGDIPLEPQHIEKALKLHAVSLICKKGGLAFRYRGEPVGKLTVVVDTNSSVDIMPRLPKVSATETMTEYYNRIKDELSFEYQRLITRWVPFVTETFTLEGVMAANLVDIPVMESEDSEEEED